MILRLRLVLTSYVPLFLILALRVDAPWWRIGFGAASVLFFVDAMRLTVLSDRSGHEVRRFGEVSDAGGEVAAYVATYILPLITVGGTLDTFDVLAFAVYGITILIVSVQSSLVAVNPTFYLLRWRVLRVKSPSGTESYLICNARPPVGEPVSVVDFGGAQYYRVDSRGRADD